MALPLKITMLGLLLATTPALHAQEISAGVFENLAANNAYIEMHYANTLGINRNGSKIKTGNKPPKTATSLLYEPTAALKQQTVQGYIERLKTKNPVAAGVMATNFGPGKYDYSTIYQGLIKGYGLRDNDAVDAVVAYIVLGYMVVNNVQSNDAVSPVMVRGVQAQFGPRLSQDPKLNAPGVPARLGEEVKLQFVVVQGGWQSAIRENALRSYQQGVATLFSTKWGLDFTKLTLTDQGFAKK